jgi:hypothetical protein
VRPCQFARNEIGSDRFQKTLVRRASATAVGDEIQAFVPGFDQDELHPIITFDAGHFGRGLKARTGRCRFWNVQHSHPLLASSVFPYSSTGYATQKPTPVWTIPDLLEKT